jgi:hypothetical protein
VGTGDKHLKAKDLTASRAFLPNRLCFSVDKFLALVLDVKRYITVKLEDVENSFGDL